MVLANGARLGFYQIVAPLGAGGMGEVYRARDTKLDREVAIKVLPEVFVADPERVARFTREAKTLAALNHPNIASIYGLEESNGVSGLVLELVEGPTLADRIAQGPIPLEEALPIARQIADALETAHEQGIVHRDLKPANIKLRPDGTVKVLDFGLAKALATTEPIPTSTALANSPTITSPVGLTGVGVLLGTAAYMSPEQTRGRAVDKRADIWAFGCLLFEMLTGTRAFGGETLSDTIAAILTADAAWPDLPAQTPANVRSLIEGCLEKDPARRMSDIAVAKFLLDRERFRGATAVGHPLAAGLRPRVRWRVAGIAAASALAGAIVASAIPNWRTAPVEQPPLARFGLRMNPGNSMGRTGGDRDLAISPLATHIAYVGASGDLFVRGMEQLDAAPLGGLRGSRGPFFSPDGRWLGFFDAGGFMKKIAVTGGAAITICATNAGGSRGAAWLDDDTIVFATNDSATGLWRVPASGGTPTPLTTPDTAAESDHLWPHAVPGRRGTVMFTSAPVAGTASAPRTMMLDLTSDEVSLVMDASADARYLASGHLLYLVPGGSAFNALRVARFDLAHRTMLGESVSIGAVTAAANFGANFAVSVNGTLVYSPNRLLALPRQLAWVDRSGREEVLETPPRAYLYPRISPDGSRVALDARDEQSDLWIWEFGRKTLTRLTTDPSPDRFPVWTPDGQTLLYTSERDGRPNIYRQQVDATIPASRITSGPNTQAPMSITPDGTSVIVRESAPGADLMLLALVGDATFKPLVKTTFVEQNGEISPDGRWMAYESNESGEFEIYVRPFPDVERARWQVSNGGGITPLWSRDGRALYFVSWSSRSVPERSMMVVSVEQGAAWRTSAPQRLPVANPGAGNPNGGGARSYDIGTDGRFLMLKPSTEASTEPFGLVIVLNGFHDLQRLAVQ